MKLIVGLGNPGNEYKNNRHNAGFMFVEEIAKLRERTDSVEETMRRTESVNGWKFDKYLKSEVSKTMINNQEMVLAKPQTYMNKSGSAVSRLIENCKLKIENLIIVHDDLDIPLGKFRIDFSHGPRLHNGILSIEQLLKTQDFWRVRIGVDNRAGQKIPGETYVLQDFKEEEREIVNNLFPKIFDNLSNQL